MSVLLDPIAAVRRLPSRAAKFSRFSRDDRGAAAIEFALVAIPFFMFIFCLIGASLYFFVYNSIEKGMDEASRLIRTGEAVSSNMTVGDFKNKICSGAGGWIKCDKLQVWTQPFSDWSSINNGGNVSVGSDGVHNCVGANNTVNQNTAGANEPIATYSGTASSVVIVTVCYPWDYASKIPFLQLENMQNGSMMIQTSTAFRTEPYPGAGS